MKYKIFIASSIALFLSPSVSHAAVVTAPGPTGDVSVKYIDKFYDYSIPYADSWRADPEVIRVTPADWRQDPLAYAVASANGPEIHIQFRDYDNTYTKPITAYSFRRSSGSGYELSTGDGINVTIPIHFTEGAAQTPYQIDISANLFSGAIITTGVQSWFEYVTTITGTDSSGAQHNLLDFHTAPNSTPCAPQAACRTSLDQDITLSAALPLNTDIQKISLNFALNLLQSGTQSFQGSKSNTWNGAFNINSISIHPLAAVPEPGMAILGAMGLIGIIGAHAKRQKKTVSIQ